MSHTITVVVNSITMEYYNSFIINQILLLYTNIYKLIIFPIYREEIIHLNNIITNNLSKNNIQIYTILYNKIKKGI